MRVLDPVKTDSDSVCFYSSADDAKTVKKLFVIDADNLSPRSKALKLGIGTTG